MNDHLTQLAKGVASQRLFTSIQSLDDSLESRQQALEQNKTHDQYLVFKSVPLAQYRELGSGGLRSCRFFYNTKTGILIAKLKPDYAHEHAIEEFDLLIFLELRRASQLDSDLISLGSETVIPGTWWKEADCSWLSELPNELGPSFVVEVGSSKSMRNLDLSARSWLETESSSVKLVVTININREHPEIILHRWELETRTRARTRSSPPVARRTAFIILSRINDTRSITG